MTQYNSRLHRLSDCRIFFDFDNTITTFDVLDGLIKKFSINQDWEKSECLWKSGKIGSKECLKRQLAQLEMTKQDLDNYISTVNILPNFDKLVIFLKQKGIQPVILSDSFSPIIKDILKAKGIKGVKVFANNFKLVGNKVIPSFPYANNKCGKCGHCKKNQLKKREFWDKLIMYVGDGRSDVCPAQEADIVFAKGYLLEFFKKKKKLCMAFNDFADVLNYFRRLDS
ncbi:MAG: MtnX-like HAD-IB family phosphatase [Candidatus Omnitrophica bacterium]|nr:MtnX-like HAD-IB family phosphatase [Candidatus Omnitrophota bacterium]